MSHPVVLQNVPIITSITQYIIFLDTLQKLKSRQHISVAKSHHQAKLEQSLA